jgi:hypothetical protein
LVIGIVVIAAIWTKVRLEAGESLKRAQEFERVNYTRLAITAYRHTVRWYSPGSKPVEVAVERLQTLGDELQDDGKPAMALEAYRALRSGIFAVRSFYTPYGEHLPVLNRKIATLMAAQEGATEKSEDQKKRIQHHEKLLSVDRSPSVFWSLVATFGFVAWCSFLVLLSRHGFDDETGKLLPKSAARWAIAVFASLAVWTIALVLA